jgi:hypothetical protein
MRSELGRISRDEGKPVSDLVRESIDRMILLKRFRALRRRAMRYAEARGILEDSDVYRVMS